MSVLDRLWRIARAEANTIARKARDLAQRKDGAPAEAPPTAEDAAAWERASRQGAGHADGHSQRASAPTGQDPAIAAHYAALKLPYGAGLDDVKSAYRKAMRQYHPDRHSSDPRRTEAATRVAQHITESYQALKDHLSR